MEILGRSFVFKSKLGSTLSCIQDTASGELYACRIIYSPSYNTIRALNSEINIITQLQNHPNIIHLVGHHQTASECILLYQYCKDGSLENLSSLNPLQVMHQVAHGILHMQSRQNPIIHRNLNPQKILLNKGNFVITGFISGMELGEVQSSSQVSLLRMQIMQFCDSDWLAPELFDLKNSQMISTKIDIWGLGMILYWVCYKMLPFETSEAHKMGNYILPNNTNWKLADLFQMTLDPDPAKRADIMSIIDKIVQQKPSSKEVNLCCSLFYIKRKGRAPKITSHNSTAIIVHRATLNNNDPPSHNLIARLIQKAWEKPKKIEKFFKELCAINNMQWPQVRLKVLVQIHKYLQQAPGLVFQYNHRLRQCLKNIEVQSECRPNDLLKSEYFRHMTSLYCFALRIKSQVHSNRTFLFNGMYELNSELSNQFQNTETNEALLSDLLSLWKSFIELYRCLAVQTAPFISLRRYCMNTVLEEQRAIALFSDKLIAETGDLRQDFLECCEIAKLQFQQSDFDFPVVIGSDHPPLIDLDNDPPVIELSQQQLSPKIASIPQPVEIIPPEAPEPIQQQIQNELPQLKSMNLPVIPRLEEALEESQYISSAQSEQKPRIFSPIRDQEHLSIQSQSEDIMFSFSPGSEQNQGNMHSIAPSNRPRASNYRSNSFSEYSTPFSTAQQNSNSSVISDYELIDLTEQSVKRYTRKLNHHINHWDINIESIQYIKQIGTGSSCDVWMANYMKLPVAVKFMKAKLITKKKLLEFSRDLSLMIKLKHPNLLLCMGAHLQPPLFIMTELCNGGDLFHLLHRERDTFISWQQKIKICQDVAHGMHFLHSNNIIHRDLKSLNILLVTPIQRPTDPVYVKVSDFGLSRVFKSNLEMTGQMGTCQWMAPEVLKDENYSCKADIYSFAILMYEIITRQTPYQGIAPQEIKELVLRVEKRPDLDSIPPNCPDGLKRLMLNCWRTDPNRRPSFSAIVDILSSIPV